MMWSLPLRQMIGVVNPSLLIDAKSSSKSWSLCLLGFHEFGCSESIGRYSIASFSKRLAICSIALWPLRSAVDAIKKYPYSQW